MAELIGGLDDVNSIIRPLWTASDHALGITDLVLNSGSLCFSRLLTRSVPCLLQSGQDHSRVESVQSSAYQHDHYTLHPPLRGPHFLSSRVAVPHPHGESLLCGLCGRFHFHPRFRPAVGGECDWRKWRRERAASEERPRGFCDVVSIWVRHHIQSRDHER